MTNHIDSETWVEDFLTDLLERTGLDVSIEEISIDENDAICIQLSGPDSARVIGRVSSASGDWPMKGCRACRRRRASKNSWVTWKMCTRMIITPNFSGATTRPGRPRRSSMAKSSFPKMPVGGKAFTFLTSALTQL